MAVPHPPFDVSRLSTQYCDPALRAQYVEPSDITGLRSEPNAQNPKAFNLAQNYPNPFNPSTIIKFNITQSAAVTLSIYNVSGQKVATLVNQKLSAGSYEIDWNQLFLPIMQYD